MTRLIFLSLLLVVFAAGCRKTQDVPVNDAIETVYVEPTFEALKPEIAPDGVQTAQKLDLSKFSSEFQRHSRFNDLVTEISKSPTLVGDINRFTGEIELNQKGMGYYDPARNIISMDATLLENAPIGRYVAGIAHEIGHAITPKHLMNLADARNPDEASKKKMVSEGIAIRYEYLVSKEIGSPMWSDDGFLGQSMDQLARQYGYNSPAFDVAVEDLGIKYYENNTPSGHHESINYLESYAVSWIALKTINERYEDIDWSKVRGKASGSPSIDYRVDAASGNTTVRGFFPLKQGSSLEINHLITPDGRVSAKSS